LQAAGYQAVRRVRAEDVQRRGHPQPHADTRDVVRNITGLWRRASPRDRRHRGHAAAGPLRVVNGYFVNGQEPGSEKFAYKMRWLRGLRELGASELAAHPRLVLLGDFNIAPEDRDSYDPVGLRETIHHTTEEREHFRSCWRWA
jgi:exodeoxyribonuclease-3